MKKTAALLSLLLALAFTLSCTGTIKKAKSSLVTVKISSNTAMLDIRPATPFERAKNFLARTFSPASAYAAIPSIVQDLRLTVSAADMTTITATVNVVGLSSADFIVEVPNGSQRHFVVEGLDSGATIQYRGDAFSDLNGDPALLTINMVSASDVTAPIFSGATAISVASSTSVSLSWNPATDNVTSSANMVYLIYKSTTAGGENFSVPDYSTPAGATTYTATGLTPGTAYYFVVRAKDEAGNIDSNIVELSTTLPDSIPPTFAGLVSANVLSSTSVQLNWLPATDNVSAQTNIIYLIYQATSPSGEVYTTPSYTTTAGATSYTVTGLTPATTYYFVARAMDEAGNIDSNTIERTNTTPDSIPPVFGGATLVSNITTSTMLLSWALPATDNVTPQSNIVYLIYQATTSGAEDYALPTYTTAPGATSYQVSNLALGNAYYFVVRARDGAGNIDGNTVEVSGYYPGLYVNVNTGLDQASCGTPVLPCKTITFALSMAAVNENVWVAPGSYSLTSGEIFPLQLKTGTSLGCYGANFSTVIDDSAGSVNDTIIKGAAGAFIEGCKMITADGTTGAAIDDIGSAITVNLCSVNSGSLALTGIQLSAKSTVMNSTISGFRGAADITHDGLGIRVTTDAILSGNTITGNDDGISVSSGNPSISGNVLQENTAGLNILDGSPTINTNTIVNNGWGIISSGTSTANPLITGNSINGNINGYGIEVDGGTPSISSNTISGVNTGIYVFGGTPTISSNTIMSNVLGIWHYFGSPQILGNSIYYNTTSGISISSSTSPVITGNSLFCNTDYDVNLSPGVTTIDISNNSWDHASPNPTTTGYPSVCTPGLGIDICISGLTVVTNTTSTVVSTPCLP